MHRTQTDLSELYKSGFNSVYAEMSKANSIHTDHLRSAQNYWASSQTYSDAWRAAVFHELIDPWAVKNTPPIWGCKLNAVGFYLDAVGFYFYFSIIQIIHLIHLQKCKGCNKNQITSWNIYQHPRRVLLPPYSCYALNSHFCHHRCVFCGFELCFFLFLHHFINSPGL